MSTPDISPLAKRLAEENNVDWQSLAGSGSGGKVVERDVLEYLARVMAGEEAVDPTPEPLPSGMEAWPDQDVAAFGTEPGGQANDLDGFRAGFSENEAPPVAPIRPEPIELAPEDDAILLSDASVDPSPFVSEPEPQAATGPSGEDIDEDIFLFDEEEADGPAVQQPLEARAETPSPAETPPISETPSPAEASSFAEMDQNDDLLLGDADVIDDFGSPRHPDLMQEDDADVMLASDDDLLEDDPFESVTVGDAAPGAADDLFVEDELPAVAEAELEAEAEPEAGDAQAQEVDAFSDDPFSDAPPSLAGTVAAEPVDPEPAFADPQPLEEAAAAVLESEREEYDGVAEVGGFEVAAAIEEPAIGEEPFVPEPAIAEPAIPEPAIPEPAMEAAAEEPAYEQSTWEEPATEGTSFAVPPAEEPPAVEAATSPPTFEEHAVVATALESEPGAVDAWVPEPGHEPAGEGESEIAASAEPSASEDLDGGIAAPPPLPIVGVSDVPLASYGMLLRRHLDLSALAEAQVAVSRELGEDEPVAPTSFLVRAAFKAMSDQPLGPPLDIGLAVIGEGGFGLARLDEVATTSFLDLVTGLRGAGAAVAEAEGLALVVADMSELEVDEAVLNIGVPVLTLGRILYDNQQGSYHSTLSLSGDVLPEVGSRILARVGDLLASPVQLVL